MNSFHILLECLPWLGFVWLGLYFLLTALVPSWRDKNWERQALCGYHYFNQNPPLNPNAWLVQMGFAKPRKPIGERDFDERLALLLYYASAALFLFAGMGGLVLIVYRSIS